ncbi:putative cysteine peptidase [Spiroplasma alleghenense]|uniref:Uncharacterized protein n=1 Tax=Spiroplasma alleghenense TaxID=216931 RepID=A0A345Z4X3_9MOLU|nr:hypothetical protein [Spiroplasma alleghenense]AXK51652.1 hypothetical protein SALLE_v1c09820 [Spiroplasma alleghenense]
MKNKFSNKIDFNKNEGGSLKIGRFATDEEIKKFSYLVPNYEWLVKLQSYEALGFTNAAGMKDSSGNSTGLCEYISLATLMTYQELFCNSGYFTDSEWKDYFALQTKIGKFINMPYHRYHNWSSKENSLVTKLWNLNDKKIDIKFGGGVDHTLREFLEGKEIKDRIHIKSCWSTMHTSQPETKMIKNNVPVMLSFALPGIAHNVVIYGYNKKTKSYLVHWGWPTENGERFSAVIIPKLLVWQYLSLGFWNAFYTKSKKAKSPKPRFEFDGKMYTWNELEKKGLTFKDVEPY